MPRKSTRCSAAYGQLAVLKKLPPAWVASPDVELPKRAELLVSPPGILSV
jgi:hypothetical protein